MSAYRTTDFTSPPKQFTQRAPTTPVIVMCSLFICFAFFLFVLFCFLYFFLDSQQNHTHSICFSKMQQTINIEME